jgi:nucleotide-binding universal stress UspA family protein
MKTILVPVEDHGSMEIVMRSALLVAQKFGSYIEGAALGPDFTELAASDFSLSGMVFDEKTQRELLAEAARRFDAFMLAAGVARQGSPDAPVEQEACSCGWVGGHLMTDRDIGEYGRVFDLIVVGKPADDINVPRRKTFEAALFDSGRPVLIVPPEMSQTLGRSIAIVWNGSSETARTVALAMPLILLAQDVIVLDVPHSRLAGPSGEELAQNLRRHGITVRSLPMAGASKPSGSAVLEKAKELGADLLIKGGYTQSRLRELIFGSVTSEVLANMHMPVFMAH